MDTIDLDKLKEHFINHYDEHADAVYRFCLFQTSSKTTAQDLSQDAFIKTWDYLASGKKVDNLKAFIFKVARNTIIDYRRKKKSHSLDAISETGVEFDSGVDAIEQSEIGSDIQFVLGIVEDLDEHYRELIVLRYVNDYTITEIAEMLDERPNTVSVKLHRAVEKLRSKVETYEK